MHVFKNVDLHVKIPIFGIVAGHDIVLYIICIFYLTFYITNELINKKEILDNS